MTLCLAAVTKDLEAIVTASDTMIGFAGPAGHFSYDACMLKLGFLADSWRVMYAGNDISHLTPVVDHIRRTLFQPSGSPLHPASRVEQVAKDAYRSQWVESLDDSVMRRHGITHSEYFDAMGWERIPPESRRLIAAQVAEWDLELDLLIYGFDNEGPHIFKVSGSGSTAFADTHGFAVVGANEIHDLVLGHLARKRVNVSSVPEAIIHLCQAKSMVEGQSGIGPATNVTVMDRGDEIFIENSSLEPIRQFLNAGGSLKEAAQMAGDALTTGLSFNRWQDTIGPIRRD
jgi:hypothetical protein